MLESKFIFANKNRKEIHKRTKVKKYNQILTKKKTTLVYNNCQC